MNTKSPKHSTNAETLIDQAPLSKNRTHVPVILHPEEVNQTRQQTRSPIYSIVGSFFLSAGVAAGAGYAYLKQLGPFRPENITTTIPSSSSAEINAPAPELVSLPRIIDTSDKLQIVLKAGNIKATAEDFQKADQNNLYMYGLAVEPILDQNGAITDPLEYRWATLKGQQFSNFNDEDILIATMVKNPKLLPKLRYLGIQPMATAQDTENPSIKYHYYHCTKPGSAGIASIAIVNDRERNLTLYPLRLPVCKPEEAANP